MPLRAASEEISFKKNLYRIGRKSANCGSVSENGNVPYLYWNDDMPQLSDNFDNNANPNYGSVSRGSVWRNLGFQTEIYAFRDLIQPPSILPISCS